MTNPHSAHYRECAITIEPIDVLVHAPFALGNAIKYVLRAGHKGDAGPDLAKARAYINLVGEDDEDAKEFFRVYGHLLRKWDRLQYVHGVQDLESVIYVQETEHAGLNLVNGA